MATVIARVGIVTRMLFCMSAEVSSRAADAKEIIWRTGASLVVMTPDVVADAACTGLHAAGLVIGTFKTVGEMRWAYTARTAQRRADQHTVQYSTVALGERLRAEVVSGKTPFEYPFYVNTQM